MKRVFSLVVISLLCLSMFTMFATKASASSDLLLLPAAPYGWQYSDSSHNTLMVNPLAGPLISVSERSISASPSQTVTVSVNYQVFAQSPPNNPSEIDQLFFVESWTPTWPPQGYTIPLYIGIPGLSPGVTQTSTISFTVPSVSGTYYLWLCFEAQYSMQDAVNQRTQSMTGLPGHIKIVVTPPANQPPSVPTIPNVVQGVQIVQQGNLLDFTSSATDPDGDKISITFDWGDGTQDTVGPTNSPASVIHDHSWTSTGMYEVKAKATDVNLAQSGWSTSLEITVVTGYFVPDENGNANWGGYMVRSPTQSIVSAEGRWYVPAFGTETTSTNAIWIGIGGYPFYANFLQAGVEALTNPDTGTTFYCAFWEAISALLGPPHLDDPSKSGCWIFPGDAMDASLVQISYGNWEVQITDWTRGWTLTRSPIIFLPDQTTAEWILELGAGGTDLPSSFGTVEFGSATVGIGSTTYQMGLAGHSLDTELYEGTYFRNNYAITSTSPIQNYNSFDISDTGSRPGSGAGALTTRLSLHSSAELHVYDSSGNHLGYNSTTGLIDDQIPDSFYYEDSQGVQYALLVGQGQYKIELVGTGDGETHLNIVIESNGIVVLDEWINGTTSFGATETHHLYVPTQGTPVIDDTPPTTKLVIGAPKYAAPTRTYVTKDSLFTLTADDGTGSGVAETAYRISNNTYDSGWTHYTTPFNLTSLSDGSYTLLYNSTDNAGNVEATNTINVTLAYAIALLSGNKHITLTGSDNVVIITGGNDIIDATQATATTIFKTGAGNDIINLGGGNSIVTETAGGNDIITTGNGNNTITITGNGNYQITTGSGNDQIQITGDGNSIIKAGNGNNAVTVSGKGNNQITTGNGNDVVVVGNGNNIIKTGAGNDIITVGNGNNNIDGGTGYDICIHGTGHNTILNCEKT